MGENQMKIAEQHQVIMALGLWFVEDCTDAERHFLDKAVKYISEQNGNTQNAMTQAWFELEKSEVRYSGCILWNLADVIEKIKDRYVKKG